MRRNNKGRYILRAIIYVRRGKVFENYIETNQGFRGNKFKLRTVGYSLYILGAHSLTQKGCGGPQITASVSSSN